MVPGCRGKQRLPVPNGHRSLPHRPALQTPEAQGPPVPSPDRHSVQDVSAQKEMRLGRKARKEPYDFLAQKSPRTLVQTSGPSRLLLETAEAGKEGRRRGWRS